MEEKKLNESMLKKALKKKYEISSIRAIMLFIILSCLLGVTVYLLMELLFSIVRITSPDIQTAITKIITNMMPKINHLYLIPNINKVTSKIIK